MTEPAITKRDCPDTKWRLEQSPTALALSLIALLVGIVWVLGGAWRWSKPAEIALSALVVAVLAVPVVRTAVRERMIRRRQTASPIPPGDSSANRAHAYRRRWGSTGVTFIEQTKTEEIRHGWLSRLFGAAPFHGVFLMVPVDEIIDANAEKLHSISTRFREQIGAARDVWSGNVPIYVVFTKPERLQGFLDCYAHLSKPDQGRVWTATFDQAADADVAKRFRHEFDALVNRLLPIAIGVGLGHHGSVAGEHAVRLPLALSELRKKLVTVLALAFRFDGESRGASLRGFFFTTRETKAQILKDLFERLVRPAFDARTRQLRFAVGGAALALAIGLFVPALRSHLQAREAIHDATKLIAHRWREEAPLQRKLASLDSMQSFLHRCKHDRALADDAFEDLCHAAAELYGKRVKHTFIDPCQARLEDGVRSGIASGYLEARTRLRLYLMLADTARLDRTWASGRLAQTWIEATGSVASSEAERRAIRQHIENYLVLLERGSIKTPALDKELIERARAALQGTPSDQIYFDMLIRSLDDGSIR